MTQTKRPSLTVGVAIVTLNESRTIRKTLESISWADEIVVVDSGSTDGTQDIVKSTQAKLLHQTWMGYAKQKQFAIDQLTTDWILVLDGDEWLDQSTLDFKEWLNQKTELFMGFRLHRAQIFLNRLLRHGRGIDTPIRLFKKGKGHFNNASIHEEILIQGACGEAPFWIIHLSAPSIHERLQTIFRDVEAALKENKSQIPYGLRKIVFMPISYFLIQIFKRSAWKDGIPGLIFSLLSTFEQFLLCARIYESQQTPDKSYPTRLT